MKGRELVKENCTEAQPCRSSCLCKIRFGFDPPYSPGLTPSEMFLFANLERPLGRKKIITTEEVIAETEAYFEAKGKSNYKSRCIASKVLY